MAMNVGSMASGLDGHGFELGLASKDYEKHGDVLPNFF
jgi:hypothetical protein